MSHSYTKSSMLFFTDEFLPKDSLVSPPHRISITVFAEFTFIVYSQFTACDGLR